MGVLQLERGAAVEKAVLVIGANGRLGQTLCSAFRAEGWKVLGQVRRDPPRSAPAGIAWVRAALDDPAALATAAGRADVVVHAVNPPYTRWSTDALPLARKAIDAAKRLGALLMFPGNVYNFGAGMPVVLSETTPQLPTTRKGRIRVEMEQALREAAQAGLRVAILRAGDFFGGPGRGSWFDLVLVKSLDKGQVVYPGRTDQVHAWAYLPDLARAFVLTAERRAGLAPFEVLHFSGHSPTGEQLLTCITDSARRLGLLDRGTELKRSGLPWTLLRIGGLVVPMWRELAEMRYLWNVPHRLSGERLSRLVGDVPATSLDDAMDATLRALFRS
jgi:nucleoside-diphosphate-sugar epimerase